MILIDALPDQSHEDFEIKRLEDGVADGVGRNLVDSPLSRRGEDHHMRSWMNSLVIEQREKLVAVNFRHHQIEENEIELLRAAEFLQSDLAILGQIHGEVHTLEDSLKKDANGHIVVNDENPMTASIECVTGHWPIAIDAIRLQV